MTSSGVYVPHEVLQDRRKSAANEGAVSATILLRKLPKDTNSEAVRTMLLFAKDLKDAEMIANEFEEDHGHATAIAHFSSMSAAIEAQAMLNGKPNTAKQANMIVDIVSGPGFNATARRNTLDPLSARSTGQHLSSSATSQKSSRFNGTFQNMEKFSPPALGLPLEHSSSDSSSHLQTIFSPQSPVANIHQGRSGKSVIEDGADDETGELLKDPIAYMQNDKAVPAISRKTTNPRLPIEAMSALKLNTNMHNHLPSQYGSPRSAAQSHTPQSMFSSSNASTSAYPSFNSPYLRHNYPPVNPADQNPPCNTLYVGNLPIDTSEDELKALFSKQRGYKRLCFRTKHNGPMCFVEFEDISFATKALNELYGVQLHNSVKGGIRLSFSKNPLGVRSGQPGSPHPSTPLSPGSAMSPNGINGMNPGAFASAHGPPPGLSAPPGLNMGGSMSHMHTQGMNGHFVSQAANPTMHSMRGIPISPSANGGYPDYMLGR